MSLYIVYLCTVCSVCCASIKLVERHTHAFSGGLGLVNGCVLCRTKLWQLASKDSCQIHACSSIILLGIMKLIKGLLSFLTIGQRLSSHFLSRDPFIPFELVVVEASAEFGICSV